LFIFQLICKDYGTLEGNSITFHNLLFATFNHESMVELTFLKKMTLIVLLAAELPGIISLSAHPTA